MMTRRRNSRKRLLIIEVTLEPDEVDVSTKRVIAIIDNALEHSSSDPMQHMVTKWRTMDYNRYQAAVLRKLERLKKRIPPIGGPNW